jgi:acyl-CoA reductase-like NAD-dependent aldehyde dehydrogenase
VKEGARLIGEIPEENPKGYFIKPTIFVDCTPDMVIVKGMFNNKNTH